MLKIGELNTLKIVKILSQGAYLDGIELGEILLPTRYVTKEMQPDQMVEVFIYLDSEDRLVAVTDHPLAMVGDFACLQVKSTSAVGAFLDWGLPKDLLVPFREQKEKLERDEFYIVRIYLDDFSKRIVASTKLDKFLDNEPPLYHISQEVDIMIVDRTDLGYKAIINNAHWGLVYENEVFKALKKGEKLKAYIKRIREDEKIDLSLMRPGYNKVDSISQGILDKIKESNGFLKVTDKSEPELIYTTFGISKKTFKMAIGTLYKQKLITIEPTGIRLN